MLKKKLAQAAVTTACLALGTTAMAATSVSWLSPPDGSEFAVGTTVTLTGQAAGQGQTGGSGLDLVLVMDKSGSMNGSNFETQKAAAKALIAKLPQDTTSVGIVYFAYSSDIAIGLTPLKNGGINHINAAIDGAYAGGGTSIDSGIWTATKVLAADYIQSRLQAMVVMSDGESDSIYAENAADAAMANPYVDAIHSVGMGASHSTDALQAVVNGADDIYGNNDDYGKYVGTTFQDLIGVFSGTGGNLVGIQSVEVTLPNGMVQNVVIDGFGNFNIDFTLTAGDNVFKATATGTDGTTATASWTIRGGGGGNPPAVPEPATMLLFGTSLAALAGYGRKRK